MAITRRWWLALASSVTALSGMGFKQAQEIEQGSAAPVDLPWSLIKVPGRHALAEWQRLRALGQGYPVILGSADQVERLSETYTLDDRSPEAILFAAASCDFPEDLRASRAAQIEAYLADVRDHPERYGRAIIVSADGSEREETAEEEAEGLAQLGNGPPIGEWPLKARPNPPAMLTRGPDGRYHSEVFLVVLPTDDPAEAPAYLRYGGWNDCPAPEVHVAALRRWKEQFGFEPICFGGDLIEGRVARRPADREAALDLAREQAVYCPDVIDQGAETLSNLGAILMAGDWWFFWWD